MQFDPGRVKNVREKRERLTVVAEEQSTWGCCLWQKDPHVCTKIFLAAFLNFRDAPPPSPPISTTSTTPPQPQIMLYPPVMVKTVITHTKAAAFHAIRLQKVKVE